MIKSELIKAISEKAHSTIKDTSAFLDAFTDVTTETLAKGDDVAIVGFGAFSRAERRARTGRDFKTGKNIAVPAYKVVRFKAGKGLKDAVA